MKHSTGAVFFEDLRVRIAFLAIVFLRAVLRFVVVSRC